MKLSEPELAHLVGLLGGKLPAKGGFTAEAAIALRQRLEAALDAKRREIPQDWREQASKFVEENGLIVCAEPAIVEAERKRIRFINEAAEKRAQKEEAERLAALPANDLLAELGL